MYKNLIFNTKDPTFFTTDFEKAAINAAQKVP